LRTAVLFLSFVSGVIGLTLAAASARIVCAVCGTTPATTATLLAAFGLGLALGAVVIGNLTHRSRRVLTLYAYLEITVGLYAAVFPLVAAGGSAFYVWFYRSLEPGPVSLTAARLGVFLTLSPLAFLMGGMLPVLSQFVSLRYPAPGREIAYLHAVTVVGAVVGCFVCAFVLLGAIGARVTLMATACTQIVVGVLTIGLAHIWAPHERRENEGVRSPDRCPEKPGALRGVEFRLVLVTLVVAGFCTLAYMVLWNQVFGQTVTTSVHSLAVMSTVFLTGVAAGILLSARLIAPRVRRPLLWLGAVGILIAVGGLGSLLLLKHLAAIDVWLAPYFSWGGAWQFVLVRFAEKVVIIFVPALFLGVAFAIVTTSCLRGDVAVGRRIGQLIGTYTLGAVFGAVLAWFALLPRIGVQYSMLSVGAVNFVTAVALIRMAGTRLAHVYAAVALAVGVVTVMALRATPPDAFYDTLSRHCDRGRILFIKEHSAGTVAIRDSAGSDRCLSISGVDVAGTNLKMRTMQKLQGYILLGLHSNPGRVLQFGFGCGETVRVGLELGIEDCTVIEAVPAVLDAGRYFEQVNHGSYGDPRVRKVLMNAKSFALLSDDSYDIIIERSVLQGSGVSSFTVDHLLNCRRLLNTSGLYSCWLPMEWGARKLYTILASFQEVFPYASIWVAGNCVHTHGLLVGGLAPLEIDFNRLAIMMSRPEIAKDLAGIGIHSAYDLLSCHVCDADAIQRILEHAAQELGHRPAIHSEDRPLRSLNTSNRLPADICRGQVLSILVRYCAPVVAHVTDFADAERDRGELRQRFEATRHILGAQVWQLWGYPVARRQRFELAVRAHVDDTRVRSNEAELEQEIRVLRRMVALRPADDALAEHLAYKLFMTMRHREAEQIHERLIRTGSRASPNAFVCLAEIRFYGGETTQAEGLLRQCLDRWPYFAEAHDRLAAVYLSMDRINAARYHIGQAIHLAPSNPLYRLHHARITATK